ncbi:MAG TPA: glycosyltransferase family 25 protein [Vitreimonas sp.]|nr:glycosyltransferase family 25 protein [Vitreimonas sp.]
MTAIFWVNLDSRQDRRAFMEAQFAQLGLAAERIAAVTPDVLDAATRAMGPTLATSELCVTASHRLAWRRLLELEFPHALILEDDAHLSGVLAAFLGSAPSVLGDLDLVRIETGRRRVRVGLPTHRLDCGVTLHRAHSDQWGTAGYLITDRCARRLLAEPQLFVAPLDRALFDPLQSVLSTDDWRQCAPGLCIQGDQLDRSDANALWRSDVTTQRRQHRAEDPHRKTPKTWRQKLVRETERTLRQGRLALRDVAQFFSEGVRWTTIQYLASERE